jgi:diguanylate cyclase (GGDEF)-like protein
VVDGKSVATLPGAARDRIVQNWIAAVEGRGGRARVALQARGRALLEGTEAVLRGEPDGLVERLRRDPQWGLSAIQSLAEELRQLLLFRAAALEGIPDLTEAQKEALHAAFDAAAVELAKWFEALARAAGDAQLQAERIRDPGTGLFNRRYLDICLPVEVQRALRYGHPLCLLAIRLDNYQELLGRWGQGVAEEAVRAAAEAIQRVTRAVDTRFYVEPDEFYVLMPEADPDHAFLIAERVREAVQASAPHGSTVSVGAACCPLHAQDPATLLARAEEAQATARRLGGNTSLVYEPA